MKRIVSGSFPVLLVLTACMNTPPPQEPENDESSEKSDKKGKDKADPLVGSAEESSLGAGAGTASYGPKAEHATIKDDSEKKAAPCGGPKIADLLAVVAQTSCEVAKATPENLPQRDLKGALDIQVTTDAARVAPGARANLTVVFTNKGAVELPLDFVADPEPHFEAQAFTPKGARADKPAGNEPALPATSGDQSPPDRTISRVTLAPKGTAKFVIPWDAVKYKWASADKAKGALPGQHFPREVAGPLPKGKYVVRVVMPLVGVAEGSDHELSQPRTPVEVGAL
jgi:hypothetical protein